MVSEWLSEWVPRRTSVQKWWLFHARTDRWHISWIKTNTHYYNLSDLNWLDSSTDAPSNEGEGTVTLVARYSIRSLEGDVLASDTMHSVQERKSDPSRFSIQSFGRATIRPSAGWYGTANSANSIHANDPNNACYFHTSPYPTKTDAESHCARYHESIHGIPQTTIPEQSKANERSQSFEGGIC